MEKNFYFIPFSLYSFTQQIIIGGLLCDSLSAGQVLLKTNTGKIITLFSYHLDINCPHCPGSWNVLIHRIWDDHQPRVDYHHSSRVHSTEYFVSHVIMFQMACISVQQPYSTITICYNFRCPFFPFLEVTILASYHYCDVKKALTFIEHL